VWYFFQSGDSVIRERFSLHQSGQWIELEEVDRRVLENGFLGARRR
jgi:hypothetical protein